MGCYSMLKQLSVVSLSVVYVQPSGSVLVLCWEMILQFPMAMNYIDVKLLPNCVYSFGPCAQMCRI